MRVERVRKKSGSYLGQVDSRERLNGGRHLAHELVDLVAEVRAAAQHHDLLRLGERRRHLGSDLINMER